MTKEIFVVCALRDSEWIDMVELDSEDLAFQLCDKIKGIAMDAKVVRRWVGKDHINQRDTIGRVM